jgi:protein SCO1/2
MRGWILLALARSGLPNGALIFVLEELDTGFDPYLVAAAARALRSYSQPNETLAPFVVRALKRIRYQDEPISFASYGEYATSSTGTSAVSELLTTLAWLGPHARAVLPELEHLRAERGSSRKLRSISIGLTQSRRPTLSRRAAVACRNAETSRSERQCSL